MSQPKPRYVYIDLLRGWAVLVMIETHVVNAFMQPVLRDAPLFKVINFINGIVAPSFLFVAGYAFAIVAERKWSGYLSFNAVFWRQVGRILQVWIIGYALHLPFFSFNKLAFMIGWEEWQPFWRVDVLHCIGASLLLSLLLVITGRTQRIFLVLVSLLGGLAVFATPLLWTVNMDSLFPLPVANYVNASHGSLFPLFPWMGFALLGAALGQLFVLLKGGLAEKDFFRGVFLAGAAMIPVAILVDIVPVSIYPPHDYWRASPGFFFIRFGIVLMLLATLWLWEQKARSGKSIVSLAGAESLVVYSGHLLAIYGLFFNGRGLSSIIGRTRTVEEVMLMTIMLIALMIGTAYFWNALKKRSMLYARIVQYSILSVVLYVFFTKPF